MKHSSVQIRVAKEDDLSYIQALSDELAQSDFPFDKDIDLSWAHTTDGNQYYHDKVSGKKGMCFVAEVDTSIVGYMTAAIKNTPSWRLVKVAELENLYIAEKHRERGIGTLLFTRFIQWAKEAKADKVAVNVFTPNGNAVAFYKQMGLSDYDCTLEMPISKK